MQETIAAKADAWPRVAVMGAGAVGCYFGGMLARAGAPTTLIGRATHVEAIGANGLLLQSLDFQATVPVSASTDSAAVGDAELVLVSVKATDTEEAATALAPHLSNGAVVVCLQNGVDGADRIRAATGINAIPAVVYVAVEMTAPGIVKHGGRGDLIIGDPSMDDAPNHRSREIERVAELFDRAGVPCLVSANIEADLWTKMIMNCAYNAISALSQTRYGRLVAHPETRDVMRQVIEETVAVARGLDVRLPEVDMVEEGWKIAEAMPNALSSTGQDIARGKRTEVDSLNGYVVRRGKELGIPTPVSQTLHALVKLLEARA